MDHPMATESNLGHGAYQPPQPPAPELDPFLTQAEGIKVSKEDRQEGYDTALLQLQPRGEGQPSAPSPDPYNSNHSQLGHGTSRQDKRQSRNPEFGDNTDFDRQARRVSARRSKGPRPMPPSVPVNIPVGTGIFDSRQYDVVSPITPKKETNLSPVDDYDDAERAAPKEERKNPPSKGRKQVWWRRKFVWCLVGVALLVAIGAGLGVGLGISNSNKSSNNQSASPPVPSMPLPSLVEGDGDVRPNDGSISVRVSVASVSNTDPTPTIVRATSQTATIAAVGARDAPESDTTYGHLQRRRMRILRRSSQNGSKSGLQNLQLPLPNGKNLNLNLNQPCLKNQEEIAVAARTAQ